MTMPQTGIERSGAWTTLAEEIAFLDQLATETDAIVIEAGRTVGGLPIHRVEIGTGPNAVMLVALQHPNEPSGREAALALVRDLAYAQDLDTRVYLAMHRVVLVSNLNADGVFTARNNANDMNLNRDWFRLTQPETQAAHAVMREVNPQVVVDLHENGRDLEQWVGSPRVPAGAHPGLVALGEGLYDQVVSHVESHGASAGRYPDTATPIASASGGAASIHAVGLISEPLWAYRPGWTARPNTERTEISRYCLDATLAWHQEHATEIEAARQASIRETTTTREPMMISSGEMVSGGEVMVDAKGYTLHEPLPEYLVGAHGIVVDGDYVSLNQPARLAVAMLCDPSSREKVVSATRVVRTQPMVPGAWAGTYAVVGGRRRTITRAWHVVDGRRRPLRLPEVGD